MNGFIVEANNRPGELARLTEKLADRGVNILIYALVLDGQAAIGWVASDEAASRAVLDELGMTYRELPLIYVMMTDKPGQTAAISRRLAKAGVNIEFWLPVDTTADRFTVALGVDYVDAAKEALGEQLTTWSYS
ncbi:MAG: hypothetical protein ACE5LB_18120 [Acidiferrobacterales bacterium]